MMNSNMDTSTILEDQLYSLQRLNDAYWDDLQHFRDFNVEALTLNSECALKRDEAARRLSQSGPPPHFRLIDCKATCDRNKVVLVDWQQHIKYTAISHTWGEDAYAVFNCECASDSSACTIPRSCRTTGQPCPGPESHAPPHTQVICSILNMCHRLLAKAGGCCEFLWHDGVCIAQHDANEVSSTIMHMGWVYASASDTVIFLHNVGNPMSVLPLHKPYVTRWNKRVWTLQEAVLSRRRRYCVRLLRFDCEPRIVDDFFKGPYHSVEEYCQAKLAYLSNGSEQINSASISTLRKDFETKLEQCYEDDSCIAVIEEECLWSHLLSLYAQVLYLCRCMVVFPSETTANALHNSTERECQWLFNLSSWMLYFTLQCFEFPEQLFGVIWQCASHRDSKHEGDRINSLLGLAGITDFEAPKDGEFEASTIKFLQRVGGQQQQQDLLLRLLFSGNLFDEPEVVKKHTWLPCISRAFRAYGDWQSKNMEGYTTVLMENGMVQLRGHFMFCLEVKFTFRNDPDSGFDPTVRRCENSDEYEQLYRDCSIFTVDLRHCNEWLGLRALVHDSDAELGKVIFPFNRELATPVFHGRGGAMYEGSSISAHLVFGICKGTHALIVQLGGDSLAAPVSKLGVFDAVPDLVMFLGDKKPFPITFLTELIID